MVLHRALLTSHKGKVVEGGCSIRAVSYTRQVHSVLDSSVSDLVAQRSIAHGGVDVAEIIGHIDVPEASTGRVAGRVESAVQNE